MKVIGREGGWLRVEVSLGGGVRNGYVSRELIAPAPVATARSPSKGAASRQATPYELALAAKDWCAAAKLLNDLPEADRLGRLMVLSPSELAYMMQGALLSMPGSHMRVSALITRVNPFAGAIGVRLAAAQKNLDEVRARLQVEVIPRSDWGARPPDKSKGWDEYPKNAPLPLTRIVVHHTADPLKQTARELQDKEMKAGYADMPYHFVITADGQIHEGRAIDVVGAHAGEFKDNKDITKDPDYGSIGIVVTGDFESRVENLWRPDKPTAQQLESLQRLINHLVWKYGISPANVLKHSEVKRDGKPKVCPGENLSPHVDASRLEAQRALKALADAEALLTAIGKEALLLK